MKAIKLVVWLLVSAYGVLFLPSSAFADTGWCATSTGSPQTFNYNFGSKQITDVSQNKPGTSFPDAFTWDLGQTYQITCSCQGDNTTYTSLNFETQTPLSQGHTDGENQYYKVNDYLEVSTTIFIHGKRQEYVPTPWSNESNKGNSPYSCNENVGAGTGSKGQLSLYIARSFVGTSYINTKILDIYGSSVSGSFGGSPIVSLYIQGTVVVPQTCEVNAGQIVTVDFGTIYANKFKTKGQMPDDFTPKEVTVPVTCNGMESYQNLTLRFRATTSPDDTSAIKTDNPDVGVQVTNTNGSIVVPNVGTIPFQLDDTLKANVTFHLYPVNVTGKMPGEGVFHAQAYIRVDFA